MQTEKTTISQLVLVPGIITLGVTLLRIIGELQNWPSVLFSRSAGGGGAIVGIAWLAFFFAIYFAVKLQRSGQGLPSSGKAIGLNVLALVILIASIVVSVLGSGGGKALRISAMGALGALISVVALLVMRRAWPAYWDVMLAYAIVARVPVIIIYLLAIQGNWNTHYDAVPPGVTVEGPRFLVLGLLPQLFFWIPWTVIFCGLFGVLTAAVLKRRQATAAATERP
jgi:hypothetical protein